jgi:hypothetical protein
MRSNYYLITFSQEKSNKFFTARFENIVRSPRGRNKDSLLVRLRRLLVNILLIVLIDAFEPVVAGFYERLWGEVIKLLMLANLLNVVWPGAENAVIMVKRAISVRHVSADKSVKDINVMYRIH